MEGALEVLRALTRRGPRTPLTTTTTSTIIIMKALDRRAWV
jgi:hypothetical protein